MRGRCISALQYIVCVCRYRAASAGADRHVHGRLYGPVQHRQLYLPWGRLQAQTTTWVSWFHTRQHLHSRLHPLTLNILPPSVRHNCMHHGPASVPSFHFTMENPKLYALLTWGGNFLKNKKFKKERKHAFDQESDQWKKENTLSTKKVRFKKKR